MMFDFTDEKVFGNFLNNGSEQEIGQMLDYLFTEASEEALESLQALAGRVRETHYGRKVYFRGLIEFSSHCLRNCYYCGLQRDNKKAGRYRLSKETILDCCRKGYELGFRTFVLQSGEDACFTDAKMVDIISAIKKAFPDAAITLSIGEKEKASYQAYFAAGAERYLLRHETADRRHYQKLHPSDSDFDNRRRCLYDLKEIGYQVGAGFMVNSPGQSTKTLARDFIFLRELNPQMIGIGPFIPHQDTCFKDCGSPSVKETLMLLSLIRLMLPKVLLPSTTALASIDKRGREDGLMAGANVVMPNLTPPDKRGDYAIYDHKLSSGKEAAEGLRDLCTTIEQIGFEPDFSRGDHINFREK